VPADSLSQRPETRRGIRHPRLSPKGERVSRPSPTYYTCETGPAVRRLSAVLLRSRAPRPRVSQKSTDHFLWSRQELVTVGGRPQADAAALTALCPLVACGFRRRWRADAPDGLNSWTDGVDHLWAGRLGFWPISARGWLHGLPFRCPSPTPRATAWALPTMAMMAPSRAAGRTGALAGAPAPGRRCCRHPRHLGRRSSGLCLRQWASWLASHRVRPSAARFGERAPLPDQAWPRSRGADLPAPTQPLVLAPWPFVRADQRAGVH